MANLAIHWLFYVYIIKCDSITEYGVIMLTKVHCTNLIFQNRYELSRIRVRGQPRKPRACDPARSGRGGRGTRIVFSVCQVEYILRLTCSSNHVDSDRRRTMIGSPQLDWNSSADTGRFQIHVDEKVHCKDYIWS